ncbi:hypothetical protein NW014_004621 [Vibrio parahaemolyticus]|nr:hypothetical protein [Vibrio parahaemolyticus]
MLNTRLSQPKWFLPVAITLTVGWQVYLRWPAHDDGIWGDSPDEHYITIKGKKPADATFRAWASFWVTGDECERYSYDMFGRRAHRGGKIDQEYTHDFSLSPDVYELRFPYQSTIDDDNCIIELRDITLYFKNDFSGFAPLNVYPFKDDNSEYEKVSLESRIEAKDCNADIGKNNLNKWLGRNRCELYVDGKLRSREYMSMPQSMYFDFSKFNDDTVIHYNVYAGENYRSKPLDPVAGP